MAQCQFRSDDTVKWWLGFGDGSDGDYSSVGNATDAPVDSSCSGTATQVSLTATNASFAIGRAILIIQMRGTAAGVWELNQIAGYTAGTITTKSPLKNTYTDSGASQAQVIQLPEYNNFTQNSGHTLTSKNWDGNTGGVIAFMVKGTCSIAGAISSVGTAGASNVLQGSITAGGVGPGFKGGTADAKNSNANTVGEGSQGAASGQARTSGGTGGGSGNSTGVAGGGGGNGAAGSNGGGDSTPGIGGIAGGNAGLTIMLLGAGGGGALGVWSNNCCSAGGSGGGIVFIIAKDITITGTITLTGGAGGTANSGSRDGYGAGGGGAGGSCLIKCQTGVLGSNKIVSSGGAGGASAGGRPGGAGSVGRIHIDYKTSYTGTTNPTLDYTLDSTLDYLPVASGSYAFFM